MATSGGHWKALYRAARAGDLDELDAWLGHDLDLDYQHNEFGTTVLIAAAEMGHHAVCARLITGGASTSMSPASSSAPGSSSSRRATS